MHRILYRCPLLITTLDLPDIVSPLTLATVAVTFNDKALMLALVE